MSGQIIMPQSGSPPPNPPAATDAIFVNGADQLCIMDSAGTVTVLSPGAASLATLTDCKYVNATGNLCLGVGVGTLNTAASNTAVGVRALQSAGNGQNNSLLGANAGNSITSGYGNVIVGYVAGQNMTTGHGNVCLGISSGGSLTTGFDNILIGRAADGVSAIATNTIAIGHTAQAPADNTMQFGQSGGGFTDAYFDNGTCKIHADGQKMTFAESVTTASTTASLTQYLNVTIGGVAYKLALAT